MATSVWNSITPASASDVPVTEPMPAVTEMPEGWPEEPVPSSAARSTARAMTLAKSFITSWSAAGVLCSMSRRLSSV